MKEKYVLSSIFIIIMSAALVSNADSVDDKPSFTQGTTNDQTGTLIDCGSGSRDSVVGTIEGLDGKHWVVPADTNFTAATKAMDLYNECGTVMLKDSSEINIESIPLIDVDGDEEFIAYIFADNYFEFYVNGQLLVVDAVPFTPFNSSVIRFKAKRPLTVAVMMVDWEENLGLGTESNRGTQYHPGDGGLVAHIKTADGETIAITDDSWQAQTFYTSPLDTQTCLRSKGNVRDSSACSLDSSLDGSAHYGAHWNIPEGWMLPNFQADWPQAVIYTNETVGIKNKKAYTNFVDIFDDAGNDPYFIWSSNLILDNVVLFRKIIKTALNN